MPRPTLPGPGFVLRAGLVLALMGSPPATRSAPSDAEEEANCRRVSQMVTENSAPVQDALERLARQRFGRSLSDLSPEQVVQLAMTANVEGRQMTPAQQQLQNRCDAYRQRLIARASAGAGIRSLYTAQGYLERWGRERVAGLGCDCPDFRPAGEDVDHRCPTSPVCPGQQGGPRIPDLQRGCSSIGAAAWIRQQLPEFYRILGTPPDTEEVRTVIAAKDRTVAPSACSQLPTPHAPPLSFASVPASTSQSGLTARAATGVPVFPAAIGLAAACYATPAAEICQDALVRGDALVQSARQAGRDRCLGYALTARTLWALGADPRFTELLIGFPEASRLRNEARIALRYLRSDCRGL